MWDEESVDFANGPMNKDNITYKLSNEFHTCDLSDSPL